MSSFMITARHKATGEMHEIWCLDGHFGKRDYGYIPNIEGGMALTEGGFARDYEVEESAP